MTKLRILLVGAALLTAACGAATTHSSSNAQPASFVGVNAGANTGANADSNTSDITNRPNPPVNKGGSTQAKPPAAKPASVPVGEPPAGSGFDRCGGGIGTDLQGSRAGIPGGPKHPLPECAVQ
jgi:hypothetical protein